MAKAKVNLEKQHPGQAIQSAEGGADAAVSWRRSAVPADLAHFIQAWRSSACIRYQRLKKEKKDRSYRKGRKEEKEGEGKKRSKKIRERKELEKDGREERGEGLVS